MRECVLLLYYVCHLRNTHEPNERFGLSLKKRVKKGNEIDKFGTIITNKHMQTHNKYHIFRVTYIEHNRK